MLPVALSWLSSSRKHRWIKAQPRHESHVPLMCPVVCDYQALHTECIFSVWHFITEDHIFIHQFFISVILSCIFPPSFQELPCSASLLYVNVNSSSISITADGTWCLKTTTQKVVKHLFQQRHVLNMFCNTTGNAICFSFVSETAWSYDYRNQRMGLYVFTSFFFGHFFTIFLKTFFYIFLNYVLFNSFFFSSLLLNSLLLTNGIKDGQ